MGTGRCPHHVRHSTFDRKTQQMILRDHCGLLMKKANPGSTGKSRRLAGSGSKSTSPAASAGAARGDHSLDCDQLPFAAHFNYMNCPTYQAIFKSGAIKNNALPTNNLHSSQYSSSGLSDLEIL